MAKAYLHDIPFDIFTKYYLSEDDTDVISENARYQPKYITKDTDTIFNTAYAVKGYTNKSVIYTMKTPFFPKFPFKGLIDKEDALRLFFNTTSDLEVISPKINNEVLEDIKCANAVTHTKRSDIGIINAIYDYAIRAANKEKNIIFQLENLPLVTKNEEKQQIYYIPAEDPLSTLLEYKSLYKFYANIDNKYFYPLKIKYENGTEKDRLTIENYYLDYTVDDVNNQTKYLLIKYVKNMHIDRSAVYYDKEKQFEYLRVLDNRDGERGKIYILPELKELEIENNPLLGAHKGTTYWMIDNKETNILNKEPQPYVDGISGYWTDATTNKNILINNNPVKALEQRFAFIDTYTGETKYFNSTDMPLSPMRKYHAYMQSIKKGNSLEIDKQIDFTKINKIQYIEKSDAKGNSEYYLGYSYADKSIRELLKNKLSKNAEAELAEAVSQAIAYKSNNKSTMGARGSKHKKVSRQKYSTYSSYSQTSTFSMRSPYSYTSYNRYNTFIDTSGTTNDEADDESLYNGGMIPSQTDIKNSVSYSIYNSMTRVYSECTNEEDFNIADGAFPEKIKYFVNQYFNQKTVKIFDSNNIIGLDNYSDLAQDLKTKLNDKQYKSSLDYKILLKYSSYSKLYGIIKDKPTAYSFYKNISEELLTNNIKPDSYNIILLDNKLYALKKFELINNSTLEVTILPIVVFLKNALENIQSNLQTIPKSVYSTKVIAGSKLVSHIRLTTIDNMTETITALNDFITKYTNGTSDNNDALFNINVLNLKDIFKNQYSFINIYKNSCTDREILKKYQDTLFNMGDALIRNGSSTNKSEIINNIEIQSYINGLNINLLNIIIDHNSVNNTGGLCHNKYDKSNYYGFIDYLNTDVSYVDCINLFQKDSSIYLATVIEPIKLTETEIEETFNKVKEKNPITKIANYKKFATDNEEILYELKKLKIKKNYHSITKQEILNRNDLLEYTPPNNKEYNVRELEYRDVFDKVLDLYSEYVYANIKKNNAENSTLTNKIDESTSFFRNSIDLYVNTINNIYNNNKYININNSKYNNNYNIKYVFRNRDSDKNQFLKSLKIKFNDFKYND